MRQTCAHAACKCVHDEENMVEKGGKHYCSEHCTHGEEMLQIRCGCGHPDCVQATPEHLV